MATFNQEVSVEVALPSQSITSNTSTVSSIIIDTAGNEAFDVALVSGTITDGVYDLLLEHGDDSGLADAATVATTDLDAAISSVQIILTDDDTAKSIGYVGKKRYIRVTIVSTGVTTGGAIGVVVVRGRPHKA